MGHGITWTTTVDAFLDEIARRDQDRQTALDALTNLTRRHPELDTDPDLTVARLTLNRTTRQQQADGNVGPA